MEKSMQVIKSVGCAWPADPAYEPTAYRVGYAGITRIERRDENLGTYGIGWYDIYKDDNLVASVNALRVECVEYE